MGLFDRFKKKTNEQASANITNKEQSVSSIPEIEQPARILAGPDEVQVYVEYDTPLDEVRAGDTILMTVMPCKTSVKRPGEVRGNIIWECSSREQRNDEVCLAYNGIPCCFMRDATGTLMKEARADSVGLEVACSENYLGNREYHARWHKLSAEERADREAYWKAREQADALKFHVRVQFDNWLAQKPTEFETKFDNVRLSRNGETLSVHSNGVHLFDITPDMKYYELAIERFDLPVRMIIVRWKEKAKKPHVWVSFYY